MKLLSQPDDNFVHITIPGKVLLCGGYSILYENGLGISFSINQIYTFKAYFNNSKQSQIINHSFKDKNIIFQVDEFQKIENKFLLSFIKIQKLFLNITSKKYEGISYEIWVSQGFYQNQTSHDTLSEYMENLKKSGLGSSSCFQVGLISCFYLLYYKNLDKNKIYILSLLLNTYAQNKIGSGYDIFTAIYGSCIFQRIPKNAIQQFKDQLENQIMIQFQDIQINYKAINKNFHSYKYFFIDFALGCDSVMSSKKFLDIEKDYQNKFVKSLNNFIQTITQCIENENIDKLKETCLYHRNLLQETSIKANIPIEPVQYSYIFDTLFYLSDQIIYCIAPGAGGYDGFIIMTIQDFTGIEQILNKAIYLAETNYLLVKNQLQQKFNYINKYELIKKECDFEFFKNFKITQLSLLQLILYVNNGTQRNYKF